MLIACKLNEFSKFTMKKVKGAGTYLHNSPSVGNELHLYELNSKTALQDDEPHVLPFRLRGNIHGIELTMENDYKNILVYGGREFILLRFATQGVSFHLIFRGFITDWISRSRFFLQDDQFVIISAHSVAIHLKMILNSKECKTIRKASCTDKSTLYCSYVHGNCWSDLVIFGGNAFGELLVWKPHNVTSKDGQVPLLHRIASHNGVIFSIDFDIKSRILITTSDDRSIRFWTIRNDDCNEEDWAKIEIIPVASGYGHISRVFQGKIVKNDEKIFAITAGEDSSVCVWSTSGELLLKRRQQFGATIWNLEYDENSKTLYTVGAMGNLSALSLRGIIDKDFNEKFVKIPISRLLKGEYLAKIKFIGNGHLVGLTNFNRLLLSKWTVSADSCWHNCENVPNHKYTLLEVYENVLAICGYKKMILFNFIEKSNEFEKLFEGDLLPGIIRSFKFLTTSEYLICDVSGNCILFNLEEKKTEIELPLSKERLVTAAIKVNKFLILSNRMGNLLLYDTSDEQNGGKLRVKFTLKQVHGNLGATSLHIESNNDAEKTIIRSTGHDGAIRKIILHKLTQELRKSSHLSVPISWIEKVVELNGIKLVIGFNDNHFCIWSREEDLALQVPCGGGHRHWDFYIKNEFINFVFIKNKQLILSRHKLLRTIVYNRNHWHVRPCNALNLIEVENSSEIIMISAGDDNLVLISSYSLKNNKLIYCNEIHCHISNVRALKVVHIGGPNFLIFSGGGRAQICVTSLNISTHVIVEEYMYTISSENMNNQKLHKKYSFDPETRIMSIEVETIQENNFLIHIGCSDGFIRKYSVRKKTDWEFELVAEMFLGKCILHLRLVKNCYILATTDGILRFINLSLNGIPLELEHHRSGVNALDVICDNEGNVHILTGGDDQSVVYSKINQISNECETKYFTNIHTAQVTGVKFSNKFDFFLTCGVDQNLIRTNTQTWQSEEILHSCVPDLKGLCLTENNENCFLFGCGLQICTI